MTPIEGDSFQSLTEDKIEKAWVFGWKRRIPRLLCFLDA